MSRPFDPALRLSEGWQFRSNLNGVDSIGRITEQDPYSSSCAVCKFKTDEAAYEFVVARAAEGSEYHIECLKYAAIQRMKA